MTLNVYFKGKRIHHRYITSETEYEFSQDYLELIDWINAFHKRFQRLHSIYPLMALDLNTILTYHVSPAMFDHLRPDAYKIDGVLHFLIWDIEKNNEKSDMHQIDIRGKLVLKYHDRTEIIYYSRDKMYRNGVVYNVKNGFTWSLQKTRKVKERNKD